MTIVNRAARLLPGVYRLWYPMFTEPSTAYNTTDATQAGADFEAITMEHLQMGASAATRSATLAALKAGAAAANHEVCAMVYVNGTYVAAGSTPASGAFPDAAYARAAGDPTKYLVDSGSTFLMANWEAADRDDPGGSFNRGLQEEAQFRMAGAWNTPTADGCWIDSLGWGVVGATYNERALSDGTTPGNINDSPLDPVTGVSFNSSGYEKNEWVKRTVDLAAFVRGKVAYATPIPYAFCNNGMSQGNRYFDASAPLSQLLRCAGGHTMEGWLRSASDSTGTFESESDWILDLNAVIDIQNNGHYAICWTKVWDGSHAHVANSADDDGNLASIVKIHRGFIASFMLVTNGLSFAHFRHDNSSPHERVPKDRWYDHANALGLPLESWDSTVGADGTTGGIVAAKRNASDGAAYSSGSYYYRRLYANGIVAHNPTGSNVTNAKLVNLVAGATYLGLDGTQYVADSSGIVTVTLNANTGYVLRRL